MLKDLYAGSVRVRKMTQAQAEACISMLKPTIDWKDIGTVDMVIDTQLNCSSRI